MTPLLRIQRLTEGGGAWVVATSPEAGFHAVAIPYAQPTRAQLRLVAARAWSDAMKAIADQAKDTGMVAIVDGQEVRLALGAPHQWSAPSAAELEGRETPPVMRFVGVEPHGLKVG